MANSWWVGGVGGRVGGKGGHRLLRSDTRFHRRPINFAYGMDIKRLAVYSLSENKFEDRIFCVVCFCSARGWGFACLVWWFSIDYLRIVRWMCNEIVWVCLIFILKSIVWFCIFFVKIPFQNFYTYSFCKEIRVGVVFLIVEPFLICILQYMCKISTQSDNR